jgi:hypothetical protein
MDKIQKALKSPKGQTNAFGKYRYRSCEDIVEAVKPILAEREMSLNITDEIVMIGDRFYVKATATVMDNFEGGNRLYATATAYAREALTKKGMDESQITGAASSYARKYALNGLFAIDDTKDADTHEAAHEEADVDVTGWLGLINDSDSLESLKESYKQAYISVSPNKKVIATLTTAKDEKKKELS